MPRLRSIKFTCPTKINFPSCLPHPPTLNFTPCVNYFNVVLSPLLNGDPQISHPLVPPFLQEARRREPCFVCGLPVFLAQRLLVNGRLHHRTCFRCARCSAQLTLANCYETQEGSYCCETCPDEESEMAATAIMPQDIGDKGGGGSSPPLYIAHDKTETDPSTASLVGLRRKMFENISHTDDEKLPTFRNKKPSDLGECDKQSDFINEPNKFVSDKRPIDFIRKTFDLSDSRVSQSDDSCIKSDFSVGKSEPDNVKSDQEDTKGSSLVQSVLDTTVSLSECRPQIVVTQGSVEEDTSKAVKLDCTDEFSSLNDNDTQIVETENLNVIDAQSKIDVDSDPEPNSYSSEVSFVQAKNEELNVSDDEIEYNKLAESKESISSEVVETKNDVIIEEVEKDNKSMNSETEVLLSHAESGSLKEPQEDVKEDEFTSLTQNIEQLVVEANNEEIVGASREKDKVIQEGVNDSRKDVDGEHKVPTPSQRTVKHKPPIPQSRKTSKAKEESKDTEEYPEELNPFGDDDEEEETTDRKSVSLNPFGSSDEDEDDSNSSKKEPMDLPKPDNRKVIPAPKITLNPFWSGDEEEEEDDVPAPVPKPRKLHTPELSPEPSPRPRRLRPSTGSLGSTASIASRKKKPAPLPPNWQPGTMSRKSYSAPKPPAPNQSPPPLPASSPPSSPHILDKDGKGGFYRSRQSSIVSETSSLSGLSLSSYTPHKSTYGQWKRKKGPAPPRPVPVRRAVAPMSLPKVRQELADIEVKQQGLERQGVKLEQTIRDKFEQEGASLTPFVEEMVLQLFELVNEKNELFRRQAELMYLRRQHNLEEEHAELEYEIRCLMIRPEANKTDSDKTKEEQLIQRLVEVVERRNEIVDCLEMDRLREKEEDRSVGAQLGIFSAAVGSEIDLTRKADKKKKKSKKEKRWSRKDPGKEEEEKEKKKEKRWSKGEADFQVDDTTDKKKSKKKWFTLHHSAKS